MGKIQVAIDGPVSAGKTTVGSRVASRLDYLFVDTGLMYRAVAWKIQKALAGKKIWGKIAGDAKFDWTGNRASPIILLNGVELSEELFFPEISLLSSRVAAEPEVRKVLVQAQQEIAAGGGVVMVGRDIGTVVLPKAEVKVFLTASIDIRAHRRHAELMQKGIDVSLKKVKEELIERDKLDSTRKDSPLLPAPDARKLDATSIAAEEVADRIVSMVKSKGG